MSTDPHAPQDPTKEQTMTEQTEPDDALADLSDAEQVELVEPTDNTLDAGDEGLAQPDVQPAAPVEEGT